MAESQYPKHGHDEDASEYNTSGGGSFDSGCVERDGLDTKYVKEHARDFLLQLKGRRFEDKKE